MTCEILGYMKEIDKKTLIVLLLSKEMMNVYGRTILSNDASSTGHMEYLIEI